MQPESLTAENSRKLSRLVARFNRDINRQRILREEIRRIVREEIYLEKQKHAYVECRPDLAEK
jgi:hypothetical protein